uniref:Interleukin-4 n=1 Tax=Zosterops lateralis melanops TaxID=1220523 RepID=A0A8D2PNQ2_ZOSLA
NNTEIFCKAAKIAEQVKNCSLEGIYDNLLKLVQQRGAGNEVRNTSPCTAYSLQASPLVTIFVLLSHHCWQPNPSCRTQSHPSKLFNRPFFPFQGPCPVAAGSTTSLKNFLKELHQVLQNEYKYQK